MLSEAAQLAIEAAIETTSVSAICYPVGDSKTEDDSIAIDKAGFGELVIDSEGTNGQQVNINHSDKRSLIVWTHELARDGQPYIPQQGDHWAITLPNETVIQAQCVSVPPELHWRWTDRFQTARRIHLLIIDDAGQ